MNKQELIEAIKKAKESSSKRNFNQSIDLIITLKDLDLKKPDNQVDLFIQLHHSNGRNTKFCGLVGPEMREAAEKELDYVIDSDKFEQYAKDKSKIKNLSKECTFFIAQANLMGKVAQSFGRILGPRNKMPNPKSGCVVPANANFAVLKPRLQNTVRILIKTAMQFQISIGKEDINEEHVADNAYTIIDQLIHHLPSEQHNIKDVFVKLTMGPAIKVGDNSPKTSETNEEITN